MSDSNSDFKTLKMIAKVAVIFLVILALVWVVISIKFPRTKKELLQAYAIGLILSNRKHILPEIEVIRSLRAKSFIRWPWATYKKLKRANKKLAKYMPYFKRLRYSGLKVNRTAYRRYMAPSRRSFRRLSSFTVTALYKTAKYVYRYDVIPLTVRLLVPASKIRGYKAAARQYKLFIDKLYFIRRALESLNRPYLSTPTNNRIINAYLKGKTNK